VEVPEFTLGGSPERGASKRIGSLRADDGSDEWTDRAVAALEIPEAPWVWAGSFTALLAGGVAVPDLPAVPGITRTNRISSAGTVAVLMEAHDSMRAEEPVWDDSDLLARLLAGEQWDVFYMCGDDWPYDSPSLGNENGRKEVLRFIEGEATCSGCWNLQLVDGQRLLVLGS